MNKRHAGRNGSFMKVAVVGGGVAGLSAGALLAARGFEVQVYEAGDRPGGSCAATRVDGFRFHDGAVNLGLPRLLDVAFARLGLDRARLVPLRRIDRGFEAIFEDGRTVTVDRGQIRLQSPGGGATTDFDREVARFLERWRPVVASLVDDLLLRPPSVLRAIRHGGQLLKLRGTAGEALRSAFSDRWVQAALAGFLLYGGVPADQLPAASVVGLAALLDEGFYLPVGGMSWIPAVLADALESQGGRLNLRCPIARIVVADGRTQGVVTARGRVDVDWVVSTAAGMATFGRLIRNEDVPRSMRRKTAGARLSHSSISIQLGLRNRVESPGNAAILPMMPDQHRVLLAEEADRWLTWFVPTMTAPELAPPGGSIVELFSPVPDGGRTNEEVVAEQADRVISALSSRYRLDVAVRRVRGPKQFSEQMHLFEGALYGLSPAGGIGQLYPHRTPVRGLYQAGQTTYPGYGVAPSMLSGILAAEAVVEDHARRNRFVAIGGRA